MKLNESYLKSRGGGVVINLYIIGVKKVIETPRNLYLLPNTEF